MKESGGLGCGDLDRSYQYRINKIWMRGKRLSSLYSSTAALIKLVRPDLIVLKLPFAYSGGELPRPQSHTGAPRQVAANKIFNAINSHDCTNCENKN